VCGNPAHSIVSRAARGREIQSSLPVGQDSARIWLTDRRGQCECAAVRWVRGYRSGSDTGRIAAPSAFRHSNKVRRRRRSSEMRKGLGRANRLHRSFVGRPSLCEGLRFLRMTAWGRFTTSTAADGSVRPTRFLVDLALRYFVSCLYNLNGFMEPLRTGIVRGGFLCLGRVGGNARSLDFASGSLRESDAALGMTNFTG